MSTVQLTNDRVRRERLAQLNHEYEAIEAKITKYEEQIKDIKELLVEARCELADKRRERASFAPVYSLPDDVWLEILQLAFTHRYPFCRKEGFNWAHSPIAFSHVSRRFRELALALPSLWTCVHVTPYQPDSFHNILRMQLRRSRDLPLSIMFICKSAFRHLAQRFNTEEGFFHFRTCWRLLFEQISRWKCLTFYAQSLDLAAKILGDATEGTTVSLVTPSLEYLDMSPVFGWGAKLFYAPLLSCLCVHSVRSVHYLNVSNISELAIAGATTHWSDFKEALDSMASTLSTLVLENVTILPDDNLEATTASFPHLRRLVFDQSWEIGAPSQSRIFRYFCSSAPNISELKIYGLAIKTGLDFPPHMQDEIVFDSVKDLHYSGFAHPNELHFNSTLFDFFPFVEHITLTGYGVPELCIPLLAKGAADPTAEPSADSRIYLQDLRKLSLGQLSDPTILIGFLERRAELRHPLQELVLDETREFDLDPDTLNKLKALVPAIHFGNVYHGEYDRESRLDWNNDDDFPIMRYIRGSGFRYFQTNK
ncbi:hypothetical protein NM688_g7681 [Phlebia brevispora]|uniref:Uncharacterized protein n=1 Tax=Phlebia brevispora TaxID=194682 RepID=A0ACC1S2A7_9APHY|nr:hypothetical protein NM688_g7681 [Phlebia brevispora]